MADKRGEKRGELPPQGNQYDIADSGWQIYRDLEGAVRLGVMQAELLKSVQLQLQAILPPPPPRR